jgi:hypothetical protein
VNCAECQTDPLTPGHYCPCCGRKLSLEEQRALGPRLPAGAAVPATVIAVASSRDLTPVAAQKASAVDTTRGVTLSPPIVDVDEIRMAKAKAVADQTAQAHLAKAANPAPAIRRPIVPVPPPPRRQSYAPKLMIAAAVIVGAIGAAEGARRLGFDWTGQDVREAPPAQVTPSASNVVPAKAPSPAPAQPKAGAIGKRASVRPANPPVQQSAPVVARTPSPEIPASAQGMPQAAESARPPAPITGRFYESNDVDEPPRIASRVAPRLPDNLPPGADKKIVVARVLVSQTGHPHRVTLLRGSTLGRASDEAVVAAVAQWTFSPAKKRGEPVNCWYNFGIPLGQAD